MTDEVQAQYEAYPYPERDPKDEARRLITGSPSLPHEMDHYLWGGARDWSRPLSALVAGGGTGDGLIPPVTSFVADAAWPSQPASTIPVRTGIHWSFAPWSGWLHPSSDEAIVSRGLWSN